MNSHTPGLLCMDPRVYKHVSGPPGNHAYYELNAERSAVWVAKVQTFSDDTGEYVGNARLLTAAWNAFESAAQKLGIDALLFAEAMQDGGIAELVQALRDATVFATFAVCDGREVSDTIDEARRKIPGEFSVRPFKASTNRDSAERANATNHEVGNEPSEERQQQSNTPEEP